MAWTHILVTTLIASVAISPGAATHAHTSTSPTLAFKASVSPDSATHGHIATSPSLGGSVAISPAGALHAHVAGSPSLAVAGQVQPASAIHAHTANSPTLQSAVSVSPNGGMCLLTSTSPDVDLPATPGANPEYLKQVFPAFAAVSDATIQFWLDRAARIVDDRFAAEDKDFAQMVLACHYMTLQGLGTGAEAEMAAAGASSFTSIRSGALSLTRGDNSTTEGYSSTSYGRQFLPFLSLLSGPLITGTGCVAGYGYQDRPIWGC